MKIGIFGGSFNPPHKMHKNIALNLIEECYLDKVIYIPTGDNYKKQGLVNFKDRYKMIEIMIKDYNNLSISNIGNKEDYKYTYQTLDYFQKKYKEAEIYFICGSDNLNEFDTWKKYEYILENYKLLVIKRNDDDINNILNKFENYKENIIITNIKKDLISSTKIRNLISIQKQNVIDYLDEDVLNYINCKNLYKK